jgi:hypothetical protein
MNGWTGRIVIIAALCVSVGMALLVGACTMQSPSLGGQVQSVESGNAAEIAAQTPIVVQPTPDTSPPRPTRDAQPKMSTPIRGATPTFAGPYPTRDPRTPIPPTAVPITHVPKPTRQPFRAAPTYTPGPRATNPPNEETAVRTAFAAVLQAKVTAPPGSPDAQKYRIDTTQRRVVINNLFIDGEWAAIGIHEEFLNGTPVVGGGGLVLAQKMNNQWHVVFPDDPEFQDWLDVLPNSLWLPQNREQFRS